MSKDIGRLIEDWSPENDTRQSSMMMQRWADNYDLYVSGYHPSTRQRNFSVMVKKDGSNVAKVKRGVEILSNFLRPYENTLGMENSVYIDIFEHTLSRDASYHMLVHKLLDRAIVVRSNYGIERIIFTGTLEASLGFVAANLWHGNDTES